MWQRVRAVGWGEQRGKRQHDAARSHPDRSTAFATLAANGRETTAHAAAPKAANKTVSSEVIDWPGNRTSGRVASKGALTSTASTPAKPMNAGERKLCPCHEDNLATRGPIVIAARPEGIRTPVLQESCHARRSGAARRARLLHRRSAATDRPKWAISCHAIPRKAGGPRFPATRRVVEPNSEAYGCRKTFSGTERREAALCERSLMRPGVMTAYRIASDLTAKAAFLLLTVLAARRLSRDEFGLFALGSAIGWLAGVVSDAGLQLHVARDGCQIRRGLVGLDPPPVADLARHGRLPRTGGSPLAGRRHLDRGQPCGRPADPAHRCLAVNAVTEFLNHLFRGLSRTDIESTVTGVSRIATLGAGAAALAWRPTVMSLAIALLSGGGDDASS